MISSVPSASSHACFDFHVCETGTRRRSCVSTKLSSQPSDVRQQTFQRDAFAGACGRGAMSLAAEFGLPPSWWDR